MIASGIGASFMPLFCTCVISGLSGTMWADLQQPCASLEDLSWNQQQVQRRLCKSVLGACHLWLLGRSHQSRFNIPFLVRNLMP